MSDNLSTLLDALPRLGEGVLVTLQLTLGGAALALVLALLLGLGSRAHRLWVRGPSRVVVEFFRGTSLVVQLFWLFYVLPVFGFRMESLACGILALGLNYGAYGAEVVRGSINAVPRGQWEAAVALDLGPVHRLRRVILPQAWALMIPLLTNLLIQLLKGSALATYILLHDVNYFIEQLRRSTQDTFFSYSVGLLVYFALAYALTLGMNALEVRAKHRLGRGPSLREVLRLAPVPATAREVPHERRLELGARRPGAPPILEGFRVTLLATVVGTAIAAVLGLVVALVRRSPSRWVSAPVGLVVEFVRSTPLLVQLVFVYLMLPGVPALVVGCAVLGVHYATYMSEVYRAGIDAVPAASGRPRRRSTCLGRAWRAVVLPQAIRKTLPGLGNYAVSMFKETPFLFAISVVEMFTAAQQFGARTFVYTEALTMVGLLFLLASYPTSLLVRRLENRLA